MDLPDPIVVLKGSLPPVGAALLLVSFGGSRLVPLAMGLGAYVAFGLLKEWPAWPHQLWSAPDGRQWLLWGVLAAGLTSLLEELRLLPQRLAPAVGVGLGAAAVWLLLGKQAARWEAEQVVLHVGGGGLVVGALVLLLRRVLAQAPAAGPLVGSVFAGLLSVDAVLLTIGRSGLLGQLCGAVAAALGAAVGTSLWRRPFVLSAAAGTWLGIAHGLFVLAGVHLASLPWSAAGLALAAPATCLLLWRGLAARPRLWTAAAAALLALPLAGACWLAVAAAA